MVLKASIQTSTSLKGKVHRPSVCVARASKLKSTAIETTSKIAVSRRQVLDSVALTAAVYLVMPQIAQAAKAPSGFSALEDLNDNYKFIYPFGWQEVPIQGADIVFKDVVEPLESVSVTMASTDKTSIADYGSLEEVSETLAKSVLTAPGTDVKLISTSQREDEKGNKYYELEFTAANGNINRHQLAVVTVANRRLYTLTTGSSERRWGKMKDRLATTIKSFNILY